MGTFWISYSGSSGHIGVTIVDAEDDDDAIEVASNLGIRPKAEDIMVIEFDTSIPEGQEEINKLGKNRLITKKELLALGYETFKREIDV